MINEKYEVEVSSGFGYLVGFAATLLIINFIVLVYMSTDINKQLWAMDDKLNVIKSTLATDAVDNKWSFFKLKQEIERNKKE